MGPVSSVGFDDLIRPSIRMESSFCLPHHVKMYGSERDRNEDRTVNIMGWLTIVPITLCHHGCTVHAAAMSPSRSRPYDSAVGKGKGTGRRGPSLYRSPEQWGTTPSCCLPMIRGKESEKKVFNYRDSTVDMTELCVEMQFYQPIIRNWTFSGLEKRSILSWAKLLFFV